MFSQFSCIGRCIVGFVFVFLAALGPFGCATTREQAAAAPEAGVRQSGGEMATEDGTPWRYRHRGHRHTRPLRKAQRPVVGIREASDAS